LSGAYLSDFPDAPGRLMLFGCIEAMRRPA
jgi:hypothetical protein